MIQLKKDELEVALVSNGITPAVAKMIVVMALSSSIEPLQDGWLLPIVELDGVSPSKRARQRFIEAMRSVMKAVITVQEADRAMRLPVLVAIKEARDSQFILYTFSPEFQKWAGLTQEASQALH